MEKKKELNKLVNKKAKILGLIKEKIKILKEDYFQERIVFEMQKIENGIIDKLIPYIDALKFAQKQSIKENF